MAIKKRSKINAEFNMSSMTDIIFLLLIFFMLTSNLVAPNALNLKLPGSGKSTTTISDTPTDVAINSKGKFFLDSKESTLSKIESALRNLKKKDRELVITISPEDKAPVESVVAIMDIAMRHQINAVLATEEK